VTQLPSFRDIDVISLDVLKQSKAWGVFPTPVDKIVNYSELIVSNEVNISVVHETYTHRASNVLLKALEKIKGLLDRKQKTIYLDLSQLPNRKNFVKLHEVGHGILPWQRRIHDIIEDDDESLSPHTNEEFEIEANYFASVTLFQQELFVAEFSKLNLGIESALYLSKLFGASIHATLRKYVECSQKKCALLVLKEPSRGTIKPTYSKRDFFASHKFLDTFGDIEWPSEFGYTWDFVKDYYFGKKGIKFGEVLLLTKQGNYNFNYQFFNNSYNGFVLIFPKGEKQLSHKKTIINTAT
jgi:Zn-dependent peptidase ImmA (M78 family)